MDVDLSGPSRYTAKIIFSYNFKFRDLSSINNQSGLLCSETSSEQGEGSNKDGRILFPQQMELGCSETENIL